MLEIDKIVIALVYLDNKDRNLRFFKKTFLLANISMHIIVEISFLRLSNV